MIPKPPPTPQSMKNPIHGKIVFSMKPGSRGSIKVGLGMSPLRDEYSPSPHSVNSLQRLGKHVNIETSMCLYYT